MDVAFSLSHAPAPLRLTAQPPPTQLVQQSPLIIASSRSRSDVGVHDTHCGPSALALALAASFTCGIAKRKRCRQRSEHQIARNASSQGMSAFESSNPCIASNALRIFKNGPTSGELLLGVHGASKTFIDAPRSRSSSPQARSRSSSPATRTERTRMAIVPHGIVARTPFDVLDQCGHLDPYVVLRVPFMSGNRVVRRAYVRASRIHHPDLHGGNESSEWLMITWARAVLSDPKQRSKYNAQRMHDAAMSATDDAVSSMVNLGYFAYNAADYLAQGLQKVVLWARSAWPKMLNQPRNRGATGKLDYCTPKVFALDLANTL